MFAPEGGEISLRPSTPVLLHQSPHLDKVAIALAFHLETLDQKLLQSYLQNIYILVSIK